MGALDVSTCRADLTPGVLKLVAAATGEAAARIEAFSSAAPGTTSGTVVDSSRSDQRCPESRVWLPDQVT